MTTRLLFYSFFVLFSIKNSSAQYNDFGSWNSFSIKTKLAKKIKLDLGAQVRLNENITEIKTLFTDVNLSYNLLKKNKIFVSYRVGKKRQLDDFYLLSQRFSLGFSTKKNFNDWTVGYRFKIQEANNNFQTLDRKLDFSLAVRNKISVNRKLFKKTYGWSSFEIFSAKNVDNYFYLSDWRWKLGVDRKVKKRQYFSLGLILQRELQTNNPVTDYIVFLGYELELKKRKKKNKSVKFDSKSGQK